MRYTLNSKWLWLKRLRCWEHHNTWTLENLGLNFIWLKVNRKVPVLYLLGLRDHLVELSDTLDTVDWLLEQTLTDIGHNAFIFADLRWDPNQDAELGWQINVLLFLFYFKQRLFWLTNFGVVNFQEVVKHLDFFVAIFSLLKVIGARAHVPTDSVYLVGSLLAVVGHNNCAVKITLNVMFTFKALKTFVYNC